MLNRRRPTGNGSTAYRTPAGAIALFSSRVVTPCHTPISSSRVLPAACRPRQARSAAVVCVSARARPSHQRPKWNDGLTAFLRPELNGGRTDPGRSVHKRSARGWRLSLRCTVSALLAERPFQAGLEAHHL